jgi:hypothetical protein
VGGHRDLPVVRLCRRTLGDLSAAIKHAMPKLRPGRRTAAVLAILVLAAVAASDVVVGDFWVSHPMLTAIVSALAVIVLSVAVIDVGLNRRSERRWRLLAQRALVDLGEAAYATWSMFATGLGLKRLSVMSPEQVWVALSSQATGPAVRERVEETLSDRSTREKLASQIADRLTAGDQILGRWAVALTESESYAEIFDRHVELYDRVDGVLRFLREGHQQGDPRGRRHRSPREYRSPGGEDEDEWFIDNLLSTIIIGARLEHASWELALRLAPQAWWGQRTAGLAAASRRPARMTVRPQDAG